MKSETLAQIIKSHSKSLGFDAIGITDADLSSYEQPLQQSLKKPVGDMQFLTRHIDKRLHPKSILPTVKSIICVRINYFSPNDKSISRYARVNDYHITMKTKLKALANFIGQQIGEFQFHVAVDHSPLVEKALAEKAGLGWIGKNTLLIHPTLGSFCFLGELVTDLSLPFDTPLKNQCGNCTKCLTRCPPQSITAPYQLDATRCIAYLTLEHKGDIPENLQKPMGNCVLGCDFCQSICPYNQNIKTTDLPKHPELYHEDLLKWSAWDEKTFAEKTVNSPLKRIGFARFKRNIAIAFKNKKRTKP